MIPLAYGLRLAYMRFPRDPHLWSPNMESSQIAFNYVHAILAARQHSARYQRTEANAASEQAYLEFKYANAATRAELKRARAYLDSRQDIYQPWQTQAVLAHLAREADIARAPGVLWTVSLFRTTPTGKRRALHTETLRTEAEAAWYAGPYGIGTWYTRKQQITGISIERLV
jgi:hypothetical protein